MAQNISTIDRVQAVFKDLAFDSADKDAKFTEATSIQGDLGLDSLDLVELVMGLEEEFGVEIMDEVIERSPTVGELVKEIDELVAQKGG